MPSKEALGAARSIVGACLALRIRRMDRALSRIYDGALRPHGVTIAQLGLLTATTLSGPVRPSRLGEILDLDRSTVSRNIALMLRRGWILATPAPDGRSKLLTLTRRGEDLLTKALPAWRRSQRHAREFLTPKGVLVFMNASRAFGRR